MSTDGERSNDDAPIDDEEPDFADDDEINQEVPVKREHTLQRIRQDYDEPWKGTLREGWQNGGDAWGRNMSRGILPDDAELKIQVRIDTANNTFTYLDNAGGMTREILEKNLIGIDTPDEEKEAGGGAGAYGRGFYVISMTGEGKTYVETRQGSDHYASTVTNIGTYSPPKPPENAQLPDGVQGTYIHVKDVAEHDMEKLSDWDAVEEVMLENFTFLLLRDDVTIEYIIDGERHQADPPDLQKYLEEGQLIYKKELPKFSAESETYQARDLYVIRTDVMDEDPPWEGVAMLKGNQYLDEPFMTVKPYKPTGIPSLRRPPQMIGWCDASDMCPELENNAHTSFRGHETKTGIKEVLMELHKEYFKKGRTTEEKQELASDITTSINELLAEHEDFEDYRVEDGQLTKAAGDKDEGPGEETPQPPGKSLLKCQVGKRRFDVGETVTLRTQVDNPKDSDHERFEIYDIQVASNDLGMNKSIPSRVIDVGANDHETTDIQSFQPTEEGVYSFSARIRPQPEVLTMDGEDPDQLDKSRVTFYVGDVQPRSREKKKGDDSGGDEPARISIVRETSFFPADDENWKAVASERGDGGIDLTINVNRKEWIAATRITDNDERRDKIQKRLGTEWGVEEVILHRNIDEIHELLGDYTIDGENAAEKIEGRLTRRAELLAKMEASINNQFGVEYEP